MNDYNNILRLESESKKLEEEFGISEQLSLQKEILKNNLVDIGMLYNQLKKPELVNIDESYTYFNIRGTPTNIVNLDNEPKMVIDGGNIVYCNPDRVIDQYTRNTHDRLIHLKEARKIKLNKKYTPLLHNAIDKKIAEEIRVYVENKDVGDNYQLVYDYLRDNIYDISLILNLFEDFVSLIRGEYTDPKILYVVKYSFPYSYSLAKTDINFINFISKYKQDCVDILKIDETPNARLHHIEDYWIPKGK
jgi:hypothetical protein